MKRILFIPLMAALVLILLGQSPVVSQPASKDQPPSGEIVGGFRVLEAAAGDREVNLTVYRGDYIKFKLADPKDSVLIPLQQLQARWPEIAGYRDKDVLIYCATGNRSTVAAKIMIDNGFKRIFNLRQGISGWERGKYPVVQ